MKEDTRINARSANWRTFAFLYLAISVLCGFHAGIIWLQDANEKMSAFYKTITQLLYINIMAASILGLFESFRKRFFTRPMQVIGQAARQVAQGDFSVRIEPQRKDGKKDEFEVIYEDLNTMIEELASNEMMKRDFISNVSHELKTPLAVIQSHATMQQSDTLTDAERREYSQKIVAAAQKLSVLVSNILQLSRLDNQKIIPSRRRYNLSEQLFRCALGFEDQWTQKHIEMDIDVDQEIEIESDEELLDIVWDNLISNALKFTPPGGTVHIGAFRNQAQLCVVIRDTGCGISEHDMKHIFDQFYQADASRATQGNGLGLTLVKRIVLLLGGRISVDSTLGVGTQFTITFQTNE